jgi:hypothetical protein
MQKKLFMGATIIGLFFLFAFRYTKKTAEPALKFISRQEVFKNKFLLQCTPDWNHLDSDSLANGISILPGWGNYQWNISSNNDQCQVIFSTRYKYVLFLSHY